jgi:hypothetical protein
MKGWALGAMFPWTLILLSLSTSTCLARRYSFHFNHLYEELYLDWRVFRLCFLYTM